MGEVQRQGKQSAPKRRRTIAKSSANIATRSSGAMADASTSVTGAVADRKKTGDNGHPGLMPEETQRLDSGQGCHLSKCQFWAYKARMARIT